MMNLPQSPIRAIHHTNGAVDDPVISSSPPPLLDPNEFPDDTDWDEISQASRQYSNPKIERAWNLLRQKVLSGEYLLEQQQQQQQHPLELFWDGSVHGGGWRCPYKLSSCFAASFLLGKTIVRNGWCPEEALGPLPEQEEKEEEPTSG
mmetsp:Transcript_21512/g.59681  ORF Transcript_21512/g.59681 Transcript_21512/m.59681 type:complete len:148 (-) Transcript_21512:1433-1876(-)